MKRYYLSAVREVFDPTLGANVWRSRLNDAEYAHLDVQSQVIASDAQGIPLHPMTLALVGAIDHRALAADAELVAMPDVPLDMKVSGIHTATKNATKAQIAARFGVPAQDVDAIWGNADGLRDVVDHYGRLNDPTFDSNAFDLNDA